MAGAVSELTDAQFDELVLKSDLPVLVDFWAPWCGPCRMMTPVMEELAVELDGKAKVYKLNVDEQQATARAYEVQSIPTMIIFKGGEAAKQLVGARPKADLKKELEGII